MKLKYLVLIIIISSCSNNISEDNKHTETISFKPVEELYNKGKYSECILEIFKLLKNGNLTVEERVYLRHYNAKCFYNEGINYRCIEEIDGIIDYYYNDTFVFEMRGDSYQNVGHYDLALKDYHNILKVNPYSANAYNKIGLLHYKLFELDKSESNIDSALKYEPEMYEALLNKGSVLSIYRLYNKALKYEKKAYLIKKTVHGVHSLGITYKNLGKIDSACFYWKMAVNANFQPTKEYYTKYCIK